MFSGIIEEFATVVAIKRDRDNIDFTLRCSFVDELALTKVYHTMGFVSPSSALRTAPIR